MEIHRFCLCYRFGTAVQVLFILNTFASFALLFYVPIEIIGDTMHNRYLVSKLGVTTVDNLCRVFFVLLCCECRLLDFPTVTKLTPT